ncbi:MAG: molybdopterin dinucleotide binding domain-containing protein, partial [Dongiaceae bacterium]
MSAGAGDWAAAPESFVELHPADAARLGIEPAAGVRVTGPRGAIEAAARVSAGIAQGSVFVPDGPDGIRTATVADPAMHVPGVGAEKA